MLRALQHSLLACVRPCGHARGRERGSAGFKRFLTQLDTCHLYLATVSYNPLWVRRDIGSSKNERRARTAHQEPTRLLLRLSYCHLQRRERDVDARLTHREAQCWTRSNQTTKALEIPATRHFISLAKTTESRWHTEEAEAQAADHADERGICQLRSSAESIGTEVGSLGRVHPSASMMQIVQWACEQLEGRDTGEVQDPKALVDLQCTHNMEVPPKVRA